MELFLQQARSVRPDLQLMPQFKQSVLEICQLTYVAVIEADYQIMIEHPLAQRVMHDRLDEPIPFVIFNPIAEEIVKWIPSL